MQRFADVVDDERVRELDYQLAKVMPSASHPKASSQRPLAHLAGEHLLCSGFLSTWRDASSGLCKEICVQSVHCADWATSKQELALLDHCWMRVTAKCWNILHRLGTLYGHRTSRLDKILFVARPEYYRRANGSEDWGLYLLSSPPTTEVQAKGVYLEFRKFSKPQVTLANPAQQFQRFTITRRLLELRLEDWRLYSHSSPEQAIWACRLAKRNAEAGLRHKLSALELAKRSAQISQLCQRRADIILAGKAEILELNHFSNR